MIEVHVLLGNCVRLGKIFEAGNLGRESEEHTL